MTTLNMAALTEAQRNTLHAIGAGQDQGHHPLVLRELVSLGLIAGGSEVHPGHPGHPATFIQRWEMPIDVHIQWAEWCAANVPDEQP